jgi:hypothetical protein
MIVAKAISIESFKVHRIGERRRSNRIGQLRDYYNALQKTGHVPDQGGTRRSDRRIAQSSA